MVGLARKIGRIFRWWGVTENTGGSRLRIEKRKIIGGIWGWKRARPKRKSSKRVSGKH